ncbi:class I glutamine amidotransferase-like protein [Phycomyces blakesleeanus]|uniref:Class I glutamine amidotransferase-like protein n=1 Tax=Phycomyces blakesleeanus TaxID=4837 RepID=A0ABR3B5P5_PHYBL
MTETPSLHLALLVCDTPHPRVHEKYGDYKIMFPHVFSLAGGDEQKLTWEPFDVREMSYPSLDDLSNGKYDGIVMTGSAASAYEDEPWILKLVEFVGLMRTEPYLSKVRMVGICFGHQIMARACGGVCERNEKGWENISQVHRDHVSKLPSGFKTLATTAPHTPIHSMLSDDKQCISIQGHPEFNRDTVRILIEARIESGVLTKEVGEKFLENLSNAGSEVEDIWLTKQFIQFLQGKLV